MTERLLACYREYCSGDNGALEALVGLMSDALVRYACKLVDPASAEDAAEDAFVALLSRRRKFADDGHLRAFLFKVTRDRCYDVLRRRKRLLPLEENYAAPFPSHPHGELYRALGAIREDYREAVYLVYLEGFSADECAVILKRSKKQVYNLLARGKAALRKLLKEEV